MSISSNVRLSIDFGRWLQARMDPNSRPNQLHTIRHLRRNYSKLRRVTNLPQRRSFLTMFQGKERKLKKLERAANDEPHNSNLELEFISALNNADFPDAVVQRYETIASNTNAQVARDPDITMEYLKACNLIGRAPINLNASAAPPSATIAAGTVNPSAPFQPAFQEGRPLPVRIVQGWQGTAKSGLQRVVVTGIVAFLVISAVGALLDQQGGGAAGGRMGGGHQIHSAETSDKRFSDVVGVDEAKAELEEIVSYLKNPDRFTRLGGKLPSGLLLMGPPGTGKTLLARAIAGEAGVPFFFASGSEFEEMYVGVGARRMRDLFAAAKKKSPCIIFIDEIDAVGSSRQLKEQQAMKMTLNQLLVEMDGFEQNQGVIVIGATNFADSLDSALTRPGRFDKHVVVPLPDVKGRHQILQLYGTKMPLGEDVDLEVLARGTPGMSGADLYNLMNQAALYASIEGLEAINMHALEYSKDKILMGAERKSALISPEGAKMTAYHEGGHALVAIRTVGADPVHKATIMPRGQALGMVMQLPEGDQTSMSRRQMLARLDVCMGGRVAEEMIFGSDAVTSGASSDIQQATSLALRMVMQWGMSDKVGIVFHKSRDDASPAQQAIIDEEVQKILTDSYARATQLLKTHRKELDLIAHALMDKETLSGAEISDILAGRALKKTSVAKLK